MAKGLDFGLLQSPDNLQTADYRSAGSHQAENLQYLATNAVSTWEEIHTVTTGKTYYISAILLFTAAAGSRTVEIAIGAAASEVTVMAMFVGTTPGPVIVAFPTPIKFSSGTRISVRADGAELKLYNLIGWEE